MLFLEEVNGVVTQAFATSPEQAASLEVDRDARMYALQFACSVETLFGLEGQVDLIDDGAPIPEALAMHVRGEGWTSTDAVPDVRLRLAIDPCAQFDPILVPLPNTIDASVVVVPIDEDWLVFVTQRSGGDDEWFRLSRDGVKRPFPVDTSTSVKAFGVWPEEDFYWLFTAGGRIAKLERDGSITFEPGRAPQAGSNFADVRPPLGSSSGVGYVLARHGLSEQYLLRYDAGTWQTLEHFEESPEIRFGPLVNSGDELVVLDTPANNLYRYDGTQVRREEVGAIGLTMLEWLPKLGLIVGTEFGELLVERDGRFESIPGEREIVTTISCEPVDDGFLVGGQLRLAQYQPSVGFCSEGTTSANVIGMVNNGRDVVVVTKNAFLTDTDVTLELHRRTNPRPACLR